MNNYLKWSTFFLIVATALIFALIFSQGLIITYDHYLINEAAQSILQGKGLWAFGRAEAWFSPYIYYSYALFLHYFPHPLNAYTVLQAFWMVGSMLCLYWLILKSTKNYFYTFMGCAIVAFDHQWNLMHSWLTADPLFICLSLFFCAIWQLKPQSNWKKWLMVILLINVAFLTRTLAMALFLALAIGFLGLYGERKIKWHTILVVSVSALLVQAIWMMRNYTLNVGSLFGRNIGVNDIAHHLDFASFFNSISIFYGAPANSTLQLIGIGSALTIVVAAIIIWSLLKQKLEMVALSMSYFSTK